MEQVVIAPPEIIAAINDGDLEEIKAWVAAGGDPNAKMLTEPLRELFYKPTGNWYTSLLAHAAHKKYTDVMQFLLSQGARVNATDTTEGCNLHGTPLYHAVTIAPSRSCDTFAAVRLLLSHGADPNLTCMVPIRDTPLATLMWLPRNPPEPLIDEELTGLLSIVRMLLRAGADLEIGRVDARRWLPEGVAPDLRGVAEVRARDERDHYRSLFDRHGRDHDSLRARKYTDVVDLLMAVRIAGSWPRYFLRPHMRCVVFRALCQRGRATYDHTTPTVLVRLFGAPPVRPDAPGILELDPNMPDLPDVVFWRVLTFMFGTAYDYPWVRPRLRARASAEYKALGGGWWLKRDAASGRWFYVNEASGHSQWDPPDSVSPSAPRADGVDAAAARS